MEFDTPTTLCGIQNLQINLIGFQSHIKTNRGLTEINRAN